MKIYILWERCTNVFKEARKGFLLSVVCPNDKILKNDATDHMDNFWISIQCYDQAI